MKPAIDNTSFISEKAIIIGNVEIKKNCGVFPGAIIRGDQNSILIDEGSNIQDNCVIHCDKHHDVKIGKNVSIGHCAMIHGAHIDDDCLIGIHATILNGAKVGKGSIVGANALITENSEIPEDSLVIGIPGKVVKQDKKFREKAVTNAKTYQDLSKKHKENKFSYY